MISGTYLDFDPVSSLLSRRDWDSHASKIGYLLHVAGSIFYEERRHLIAWFTHLSRQIWGGFLHRHRIYRTAGPLSRPSGNFGEVVS